MNFEFNSLVIRDLVLFRRATLQLDQPQLAVIRGLNRDSTVPNSNGAGKSLLFNTLPALFFDSPPTANRRKASKDIFRKGGKIELTAKFGEDTHRFTKYQSGKSLKLKIEKNDEDLKFRTQTAAQQYLESCFPLTPELFYQLVYLRGAAANVLLNGTATQRHAFFEKIFRLEDYDRVAQILRNELKELQTKQIQLETLQSDYQRPENPKHYRKQAKTLEHQVTQLRKRLTRVLRRVAQAQSWEKLAKQLPEKYRDLKIITTKYQQADKDFQKLLQQEFDYRDNQTAWNNYIKYRKQRNYYRDKLAKDPKPPNLQQLKRDVRKLQRELHLQEQVIARIDDPKDNTTRQVKKAATKLRIKIEVAKFQLAQLANGICPVCANKIQTKQHIKLQNTLETNLSEFQSKFIEYHRVAPLAVGQWVFTGTIKGQRKRLQDLKQLEQKFDRKIERARRYVHYREQLEQLEVVAKPNQKLSPINPTRLDRFRDQAEKYKEYRRYAKTLSQITRPTTSAQKLERRAQRIQQKFERVRLQQQELNQQLGRLEEQYRAYQKTTKKIVKLQRATRYLQLTETLVEAYGPKGLRSHDVQELVNLYVNNLNQFASLVFSETIEFSFTIGNRSLRISATRRKQECDICYLSGAERQAFNLLSLLALLPLIPANYRTNILILDEIENMMSAENRKLFATELLPRLQQLIPTIFVITPHSDRDFYIPNATTYQVVRKHGKSKLEIQDGYS